MTSLGRGRIRGSLEGHHFDNREAPWDEAGMKKESTERTEKSNEANHTA